MIYCKLRSLCLLLIISSSESNFAIESIKRATFCCHQIAGRVAGGGDGGGGGGGGEIAQRPG